MYEFFKNISEINNCQSMGVCSIDPTVSAIEELLLSEIREIAFYVIKMQEFDCTNKNLLSEAIKGLSVVMINTSFDKKDFTNLLNRLCDGKKYAKEEYLKLCHKKHLSCELIDFDDDKICSYDSIMAMTKSGELKMQNKYKGVDGEKQRMFELITTFAKLSAINIQMLKNYNYDTSDFDFETLRLFALTNRLSTRKEKLKRRILEFSKTAFDISTTLIKAQNGAFGLRQDAQITLSPTKGKSILISGPDLNELQLLLDTIGEREINVYTNALLFAAHTYPKFKQYKNLAGHFETQDTQADFANFPGAVLITQNFSQKIDNLLRGTVYSNKVIAPNRVFKIKNNDYEPLIQAALKLEGFKNGIKRKFIDTKHDLEEIENSLDSKEVIIIVGNGISHTPMESFDKKSIINIDCPIESDLLFFTLEKCVEKGIKTDVFFTHCSLNSINSLMCTLHLNLNSVYLANCSSSLINPHVIECLENDFDVKIIR